MTLKIPKYLIQEMEQLWKKVGTEVFISSFVYSDLPRKDRIGIIGSLSKSGCIKNLGPITKNGGGYFYQINKIHHDILRKSGDPDPESVMECRKYTKKYPAQYSTHYTQNQKRGDRERRIKRRNSGMESSWIGWYQYILILYQKFGSEPFTWNQVYYLIPIWFPSHWSKKMHAAGILDRVDDLPGYRLSDYSLTRLQQEHVIVMEGVTA